MKRKHFLQRMFSGSLPVLLLAGGLLASCDKEDMTHTEGTPLPEGKYPLVLNASVGEMQTRSAGKDTWADDAPIGVRIGDAGAKVGKYLVSQDGSTRPANDAEALYWLNTAPATITAWYPYEAKNNVDISNQKAGYTNFDYLTAIAENKSYRDKGIELQFKHQMAKVVYTLNQGEGITQEELDNAKVSIAGYTKASFIGGELTGNTDGWITPTTDGEVLLVPQDMADRPFIKVTIGVGASMRDFFYIPTGSAGNLQAGALHTYTITVARTGLEVELSVSWNDGGSIEDDEPLVPIEYYYLTLPDDLEDVIVRDAEGNELTKSNGRYALPVTNNRFSIIYSTDDAMTSLVPVSGLCKVKTRTGTEQAELMYASEYDNVFSDVTLVMEEYAHPGDYYYDDGTWAPYIKASADAKAIGVVFHSGVGPGDDIANYAVAGLKKIHGYAIAAQDLLNGQRTSWGGKLPRTEDKNEIQDYDIPEIVNYDYKLYNGFEGTHLIRTEYMPKTTEYEFPAFAALETYDKEVVAAPAASSGWYIPSLAMLEAVSAIKNLVGNCTGGSMPEGNYLTTNETDAANVRGYYFWSSRDTATGRDKNDNNTKARAALTF